MLKIIFMGTPDFAVPTLIEIAGQGHEIVACYTKAPNLSGRGLSEKRSPVHEKALQLGIPVFTPASLKKVEPQAAFSLLGADVAVVVAYGLILPQAILNAPRHGCLNLHASLLPRWRGAAPIQRAIMAGDEETGVMVMRMDEGLDTGPVAMVERMAITPHMSAGEAHDRLARLGADLMTRALAALSRDALIFTPQDKRATIEYAHKISNNETEIDWQQDAVIVHNHIRGLSPWPAAWTTINVRGKRERLKILRSRVANGNNISSALPGTLLDNKMTIACGTGALELITVQRAGKMPLDAAAFLRGADVVIGSKFG
jgi:methionyl-tRNA formyltransferase